MRSTTRRSMLVLTLGLIAGWVVGQLSQATPVRADTPTPQSGEMVAFCTDSSEGKLLILLDQRQKVFSVYEFSTRKSKLKLAAVRHYAFDHQLAEFNNESPNVAEIEKLVRSSMADRRP